VEDASSPALFIFTILLIVGSIKLCSKTLDRIAEYHALRAPETLYPEMYCSRTLLKTGEPISVLYEVSLHTYRNEARPAIEDSVRHAISALDFFPTKEEMHELISKTLELAWPYLHLRLIAFRVLDVTHDLPSPETDEGTPIGTAI
jgi:hypothetical protein